MPPSKVGISLTTELSKAAKLGHVQGGLPGAARFLPVIAIAAGEVIAKATKGPNVIEERLLGPDDTYFLNAPATNMSRLADGRANGLPATCGPRIMCTKCSTNHLPYMPPFNRQYAWPSGIHAHVPTATSARADRMIYDVGPLGISLYSLRTSCPR